MNESPIATTLFSFRVGITGKLCCLLLRLIQEPYSRTEPVLKLVFFDIQKDKFACSQGYTNIDAVRPLTSATSSSNPLSLSFWAFRPPSSECNLKKTIFVSDWSKRTCCHLFKYACFIATSVEDRACSCCKYFVSVLVSATRFCVSTLLGG